MRLYTNGKCRSVYGSTKTEVKDKYKKLKKEVEHQQVLDKSGKLGDAMTRYLYDIKRTSIKASSFASDSRFSRRNSTAAPCGAAQAIRLPELPGRALPQVFPGWKVLLVSPVRSEAHVP